jgi:hypothetical protein
MGGVVVVLGAFWSTALHAEQRGASAEQPLPQPGRSRLQLCFVAPSADPVREQVELLLSAQLDAEGWALSSCSEDSVPKGLARLHDEQVDLAVLLDAQSDVWRVHVIEPKSRRSVVREISGRARDAAANEAVVSIVLSNVQALSRREHPTPAPAASPTPRQDATPPPAAAAAAKTPTQAKTQASEPSQAQPMRGRVAVTVLDPALDRGPAWGVGAGVATGALSNLEQWTFGPQLTLHAFMGTGAWTSELRVHGALHLPRTVSAPAGSFELGRTHVGVNLGPTWSFTRRATLGLDAGLQWERLTRSHEVAADGVQSLAGRPQHRGGIQLNLIGTLWVTPELGRRLGASVHGWFGQARYVTSSGDAVLTLRRLSSGAWFSLLWRIS